MISPRLLLCCLLLAGPVRASSSHWSLQPVRAPAVPAFAQAADRAWIRNPIDAFVLAALHRRGLSPAPEADRRTLIRRVTFDLIGLPPTPEEVAAFVRDARADAYEQLVDRLLASPRHGERWGRHWLDVVRFAETEGFEYDRHRPGAWRFRDHVIASFNADKPYDRFLLEQLAGDEIDPSHPDLLVAAGFHRLGPVRRNAGNPELVFSRHEVLTETADAIGVIFLGLTMGCARCHDHKFDDIPQADYFRLQAFLAPMHDRDVALVPPAQEAQWKARDALIRQETAKLKEVLPTLTGPIRANVQKRLRQLSRVPPPLPTISTVQNLPARRTPIHILKRGSEEHKGREVGPRLPGVLVGHAAPELPRDLARPRTQLARALIQSDNPLVARVMVNRIWQGHFGRGIVETANDFGINGARPTHPELLDWLADTFRAGGWRLKPMHRLLVTSAAYRQAARHPDPRPGSVRDTDNRLLWRFPRRRLSAEELRDAMLVVSGRLNDRAGGPSVIVPVERDLVELLYAPLQWAVTPDANEHDRRSVYLIAKRNLRLPFLETFDQPDAQTSCARRVSSTHALQALELLNGELANRLARAFAERLRREVGTDAGRQVERAYQLAAGRPPTPAEKAIAVRFLHRQPLEEFALAVLNLNAFLYVS